MCDNSTNVISWKCTRSSNEQDLCSKIKCDLAQLGPWIIWDAYLRFHVKTESIIFYVRRHNIQKPRSIRVSSYIMFHTMYIKYLWYQYPCLSNKTRRKYALQTVICHFSHWTVSKWRTLRYSTQVTVPDNGIWK